MIMLYTCFRFYGLLQETNKSKLQKVYIGSTQVLNNRGSLHKNDIKLPENRKLYASKHLYQCNNRIFKIIPIYQTDDDPFLQIYEKDFIDKFKPTLNGA